MGGLQLAESAKDWHIFLAVDSVNAPDLWHVCKYTFFFLASCEVLIAYTQSKSLEVCIFAGPRGDGTFKRCQWKGEDCSIL